MTRPASELWWQPSREPHRITARWFGSGGTYELHWGHDNQSDRVQHWESGRSHTYPRAGTYQLVAVSALDSRITKAAEVIIRDYSAVPVTAELISPSSTTVRLTLPKVLIPVRFRVEWGDGWITEHDEHEGAPEHEYPAGFGSPAIRVFDLPAKRVGAVTGPEIPDPPPPETEPRMQFRTTVGKPDWRGMLELFGFPPSTTVQVGGAGSGDQRTPPGEVTTTATGYAAREYTLLDDTWQFDDWWQVSARWTDPDTKRFRQMWLPVQWCEYAGGHWADPTEKGPCWRPIMSGKGTPRNPCNHWPLLVDWAIAAPQVITLYSGSPGPDGDWSVEWEPGVTEVVRVRGGIFRATHDYGSIRNVWVTVSRPDGKTARRRLRQIEPDFTTWKDGSLAIFFGYESHINQPPCTLKDCDPYTVVRIEAGDGRPLVQGYRPSLHCPSTSGFGLSYGSPGEYRVAVHAPMSATRYGTHQQKTRGIGEGEFLIKPEHTEPPPLSQTFHVGALKPGWYDGYFQISNPATTEQPVTLDLTLGGEAVLVRASSWLGTASFEDLGSGRWRIRNSLPVPAGEQLRIEIEVNPCGTPRIWPTQVTFR